MDLSSDQQIQLAAETQQLQCHLITAQVNGHQGLPHTHLNCQQRQIKHVGYVFIFNQMISSLKKNKQLLLKRSALPLKCER